MHCLPINNSDSVRCDYFHSIWTRTCPGWNITLFGQSGIIISGEGVFSYLIGYADRLPNDCCPPHHQVGEDGDPNDAAQEGDEEPFLFLLQTQINSGVRLNASFIMVTTIAYTSKTHGVTSMRRQRLVLLRL
ncbi:hypothetical protein CDAR_7011 [Caerostris darwini]|uniref:Uncharacterized protein n=1 Tax=Caerostris darwini TaxID=1538125 RepID=A0AAV4PGE4_9ARAC|nr:hypothetical protein CDAR_7011 [Caerostris darwini]